MTVQRLSNTRAANRLYIFNDANYRPVRSSRVEPIRSIKKLADSPSREYIEKPTLVYGGAARAIVSDIEQVDSIRKEYAASDKAQYSSDNAYELQRMASDKTALLGMNIDVFA